MSTIAVKLMVPKGGANARKMKQGNPVEPKRLTPETLRREVEITAYKSSGPGGQHKNKTESSIRIKHLPTGLTAIARESRSQIKNRELAWERLIEKLEQRRRKKKPRIPTKVSAAARAKRLQAKTEHARKKNERAQGRRWEEE